VVQFGNGFLFRGAFGLRRDVEAHWTPELHHDRDAPRGDFRIENLLRAEVFLIPVCRRVRV